MAATQILVISGPIASGKSSTAQLLAARARAEGRTVAVVDLDRVYMMLDDASSMSSDSVSRQARRAAAAPTEQFVAGGIQLVVEGGLLDAGRPRAVVADSRWCNLLASASRPSARFR